MLKDWMRRPELHLALLLATMLFCFWFRLSGLADWEPSAMDQGFMAAWEQSLREADHFLPRALEGEPWLAALKGDGESFLHALGRPIYNVPKLIFTLVTVSITYLLTWIVGYSYQSLIAISILLSICIAAAVGLFPWLARRGGAAEYSLTYMRAAGVMGLFLASGSYYLHYFSPLGAHNTGILFLVVATAFTTGALHRLAGAVDWALRWRILLVTGLVQSVALYAYWTNLFLVPLGTGLAILVLPGTSLWLRIRIAALYCAVFVLIMTPALALLGMEIAGFIGASDQSFSHFLSWVGAHQPKPGPTNPYWARFTDWFRIGAVYFSKPGLILALIGLVLMSWRARLDMPLAVVLAHLIIWTLFARLMWGATLRTYPYMIPLLCLGAGYAVVASLAPLRAGFDALVGTSVLQSVVTAAVVALLVVHASHQLPSLAAGGRLKERNPIFWMAYYKGQGTLRPVFRALNRRLPDGAVLFPWQYDMHHIYLALTTPSGKARRVLPPLEALGVHHRAGRLKQHLEIRRLTLTPQDPIYIMAPANLDAAMAREVANRVLGPDGFGRGTGARVEEVQRWRLSNNLFGKVVILYAVRYP